MRIGTWNLDGGHSSAHIEFVTAAGCDVLLLTEVSERLTLPGYKITSSPNSPLMTGGKRWAAVAAKGKLDELDSPHPASAAAIHDGTTYVASVLPWKGSGGEPPWRGDDHPQRMRATLTQLRRWMAGRGIALVWGGDWNQSLAGVESAGSMAGRDALTEVLRELRLNPGTTALGHHLPGRLTIDHIAVRGGVQRSERIAAVTNEGRRLSDHDLYFVEI